MTPEALALLHRLAFTEAPRPWSADEFRTLLAEPTTLLVTRPHGFALGRSIGPEAELMTIAVHPEARRAGAGAALLAAFEAAAAARGVEACLLEVAATNDAARALYGKAGYDQVGRRPGYYVRAALPPVDALVLRKALPPRSRGKTI